MAWSLPNDGILTDHQIIVIHSLFAHSHFAKLGSEVSILALGGIVLRTLFTVSVVRIVEDLKEVTGLSPLVGAQDVCDEDLPGMIGAAAVHHMVEVGEDLGLYLVAQTETVEVDGASHGRAEPRLGNSDLALVNIWQDCGTDPLLGWTLQHQAATPDAVVAKQVDVLHLEADGSLAGQGQLAHLLLQVDHWSPTQKSAVTEVILKHEMK